MPAWKSVLPEPDSQALVAYIARAFHALAASSSAPTAKEMPGKDPKQNLAKLDELGRQSFQRAIDDIKELANLAAKSQADAFDVVRQRFQSNVDEVTKMLQRK